MKTVVRNALAQVGWLLAARRAKPRATVLMYHGVSRRPDACGMKERVFDSHIDFLAREFDMIAEQELPYSSSNRRPRVLLTFDDGFRNNIEVVVPLLRKYGVPAVFFVCTRCADPRKPLWFAYTRALARYFPGVELRFRGSRLDMSAPARRKTIRQLESALLSAKPHPSAMYQIIANELPPLEDFIDQQILEDEVYGMTEQDLRELARDPLFALGVHSIDHPLLPLCTDAERKRQIDENKEWLEAVSDRPVATIAFPGGEYEPAVLEHCRMRGFHHGYSVHRTFRMDPDLEIPRVGIYRTSLAELGCKVRWPGAVSALSRVARFALA